MSVEDRLRAARSDYDRLARPRRAATDELGGDGDRPPARAGNGRRTLLLVATVLAMVAAVAGALAWFPFGDDSEPLRVTGAPDAPAPRRDETSPPASGADDALRPDGDLTVTPVGPHVDGQRVALTVPIAQVADWVNDRPRLCAIVAGAVACDPYAPRDVDTELADDGATVVHTFDLTQRVFLPSGSRDCAEEEVRCHLVVPAAAGGVLVSEPLAFVGDAPVPAVSLAVRPAAEPGTVVVEPSRLAPDPSWLELRAQSPDRAAGYPAFRLELCAFGDGEPPLSPGAAALWSFDGPERPGFLWHNCDTLRSSDGAIDPDRPGAPVEVAVPHELFGYRGWSDCTTGGCYLVVRRSVVTSVDAAGSDPLGMGALTGYDEAVAFALVPPRAVPTTGARPSLAIVEAPPYHLGQQLTVVASGLPAGFDTMVGACHRDAPWACGYSFGSALSGDGSTTFVVPDTMAGCGPDSCYLELDSGGEGLPPPATTALPIAP